MANVTAKPVTEPAAESGTTTVVDAVIIGAGIAGLTAAAYAARSGATTVVLDARSRLGGRARTTDHDGYLFNEGPHALYRAGAGMAALKDLGITPSGGNPPLTKTSCSVDGGLTRTPPRTTLRHLTRWFTSLKDDAADPAWVSASTAEWLEHRVPDPRSRRFAEALIRLTSYSGDLTTFSADAAIAQVRASFRGVTYLDNGWAQLVESVSTVARSAGARVLDSHPVEGIIPDGGRWLVQCDQERGFSAASVVIAAGGASTADRLLHHTSPTLAADAETAKPVTASCLDLGLSELPEPRRTFVLGIDRPTYSSVHTPAARLTAPGHHVLHVMTYESEAHLPVETADLERIADESQPGWRSREAARQIGRHRVVAFDRPQPGRGMAGRHGIEVVELDGLYVAGDWVGPDDLLGGAALASGRHAGTAAATRTHASAGTRRIARTASR